MSERTEKFVKCVIERIKTTKNSSDLKKASISGLEHYSWDVLVSCGVRIESDIERKTFGLIASHLAKVKAENDGELRLGRALALCYDEFSDSDAGKRKLHRIISCSDIDELLSILSPILTFIESKNLVLNYSLLLNDLISFRYDDSIERIKVKWANQFYSSHSE